MTDLKIVVAGAGGRMGQAIIAAAQGADDAAIAGALERRGHPAVGAEICAVKIGDRVEDFLEAGGVFIDFTTPAATIAAARIWAGARLPMVIGTTGFSTAEDDEVASLAKRSAIVKSGNMSLGVNVLAALVRKAASILGDDYDIEILDVHHRAKVDAPSGTALMLARAAAEGRGVPVETALTTDLRGARVKGAIGVASLRGGGVVGDHDVLFAGASETLTLSHRAIDRTLFAKGALVAARWVANRKPGLYSMADVLGV
ncbi:MAG: 4-hydroxy-tetrahydrodipicolinate reductase [Parvularculaceae bacterium]|nr:4-hydroxy-tetrahydrodipicolinate reductase [Parvularculaceae bacterium]